MKTDEMVRAIVAQCVGEASTLFIGEGGVFDEKRALEIVDRIMDVTRTNPVIPGTDGQKWIAPIRSFNSRANPPRVAGFPDAEFREWARELRWEHNGEPRDPSPEESARWMHDRMKSTPTEPTREQVDGGSKNE